MTIRTEIQGLPATVRYSPRLAVWYVLLESKNGATLPGASGHSIVAAIRETERTILRRS